MADTNLINTLGPLGALTAVLFTLVRIVRMLHGLNVSDRTWHRIRRELRNLTWQALTLGMVYLIVFMNSVNLPLKWLLTVLLLPGIWGTLLMGNVPLEERETLPSWLKVAAVTAWIYAAVAVFGYLGLSISADVKGAKESCRLQRGGTLVGAVAKNNARCVSFWRQRGKGRFSSRGRTFPLVQGHRWGRHPDIRPLAEQWPLRSESAHG